jgi:hypothetical protein
MMKTQVITNESGFLSRMFEQLARFNETLHLARELKRRGPDGARRLLQERGLMAD